MSPLKSKVGTQSKHYEEAIPLERIETFCKAVGESNSDTAPPTFLTLFRKGEFELLEVLGLELSRALHAEQEYQYEDKIQSGDQVSYQTVLSHVLEKASTTHRMSFLILETQIQAKSTKSAHLRPIGKAKSTIVFREAV